MKTNKVENSTTTAEILSYIKYKKASLVHLRNKTPDNLNKVRGAYAAFLDAMGKTQGGKK